MLVQVVQALLMLGSWQSIRGVGVWVKNLRGQTPPWIVAAEAQAKSRYVILDFVSLDSNQNTEYVHITSGSKFTSGYLSLCH